MVTPTPPDAAGSDAKSQQAMARRVAQSMGEGGISHRKGPKHSERKKPVEGKGFGKIEDSLNYDRRPAAGASCLCGSGQSYENCCGIVHSSGSASTPAALVRARYSAYAARLPDFLIATTDPNGPEWQEDIVAWKKGLIKYCDMFEFQGLSMGEEDLEEETATVAFKAAFVQKGSVNLLNLCETSNFVKSDGEWLYNSGAVDYEAQS